MIRLRTIDAHAAGEPLRLIVDGFPAPQGSTMLEKREWTRRRADHLRRALMLEPRGHADMYGAVLTEPVSPGSHAGVLFMHNEGYSTMCGHGVIAVTTIALERGLLMPGGDGRSIIYDSPAGTIRAKASVAERPRPGRRAGVPNTAAGLGWPGGVKPEARPPSERERGWGPASSDKSRAGEAGETAGVTRVQSVSFLNVPSFVLHGGLTVKMAARSIRADVAFGGAFYAIVDGEAVGLPIDAAHLPELRQVGMEIKRAIETTHTIQHPLEAGLRGIYGTIFTGPASDSQADLRNVTIFADREVDRSPCGTGTAAVMAVVDAMGLLTADKPFVHESLIGTRFSGRVAARTNVGEYPAIVPEIEGSAWITGEHTFLVEDDDPLKDGFRL